MKNFNRNLIVVSLLAVSFVIGTTLPVVAFAAGPASVNLGSSGNFVILAKTGISTTGTTLITGDIGVSPAAATFITGFGLILPSANPFSTSAQVVGKVYAPGYADPTPSNMTTAVSDMQTAYTDAFGRTNPTATELGAGNIGGLTIAPGLYKWGTGVTIPTDVTLSGGANDIWIFQIAQNLNVSSATKVILAGGAQANNIFWVVAGQTTIGTTAVFNGNILDQTAIVLNTGATLNGRALAQTAVTLDSNSVTISSSGFVTPATPAIPATPAVPTVSSAIPATPAISATPSVNSVSTVTRTTTTNNETDVGCLSGNKFSITTGNVCIFSATTNVTDAGCLPGNKFSITTGNICLLFTPTGTSSSEQKFAEDIILNLMEGSNNGNVTDLQQFLISQNKGLAAKALATFGTTSYFGALTRAALVEFQAAVGISPAQGFLGPVTRAYIRANY